MSTLVLITSIINVPNKPLSYTNCRSFYSTEERFEQTKKTFETIREKIPNSKIFLVECSELDDNQKDYFLKNSNFFLNLYDDEKIRENVYSISKSLGEGTMTYHALDDIHNKNIEFVHLIKISGRYWLSENFVYDKFINDNIIIKKINNEDSNIFTALYKLPREASNEFKIFLRNNFYKMHQCIGYENLFGLFINSIKKYEIININPIGLSGFLSVTNNEFFNG
jgi:hypothetical protein